MQDSYLFDFDNFLLEPSMIFESDNLKKELEERIAEKTITGAFLTHYSEKDGKSNPHIKIGIWINENNKKLINDIKKDIFDKNKALIKDQSQIRGDEVFKSKQSYNYPSIIPCYSYKFHNIIQNLKLDDKEISQIYYYVFSEILDKLYKVFLKSKILDHIFLIWDVSSQTQYFFDKKFDIPKEVQSFLEELIPIFNNYVEGKEEELGYAFERLFHHCNNTLKYHSETEKNILDSFVNIFKIKEV